MGRQLQRVYNIGKEQAVIMMPLLEGLDGVNKMSKSLNNYIGVTEKANDMYAKILSISDELMFRYYELLSQKSLEEIAQIKKDIEQSNLHPKKAKENLALEITERFHSKEEANNAKSEFDEFILKMLCQVIWLSLKYKEKFGLLRLWLNVVWKVLLLRQEEASVLMQ